MAVIILILSVIIYKAKGNKNTSETEAELAKKKPVRFDLVDQEISMIKFQDNNADSGSKSDREEE